MGGRQRSAAPGIEPRTPALFAGSCPAEEGQLLPLYAQSPGSTSIANARTHTRRARLPMRIRDSAGSCAPAALPQSRLQ